MTTAYIQIVNKHKGGYQFVINGETFDEIVFDNQMESEVTTMQPVRETNFVHSPDAQLKFVEDEDFYEDGELYWKVSVEGISYKIQLQPTSDIHLDISFYDCCGNKCRRTVNPSTDYWCEGCHGKPGETNTWYDAYNTLYGFPSTWAELLRSPLMMTIL